MKTIPNIRFTLKLTPEDKTPATAAAILKLTLAQQPDATPENPKGGFTFAVMRERNRIADILDKAKPGGKIELEDADFAIARKCVEAFRWSAQHPDLLKFAELFGL